MLLAIDTSQSWILATSNFVGGAVVQKTSPEEDGFRGLTTPMRWSWLHHDLFRFNSKGTRQRKKKTNKMNVTTCLHDFQLFFFLPCVAVWHHWHVSGCFDNSFVNENLAVLSAFCRTTAPNWWISVLNVTHRVSLRKSESNRVRAFFFIILCVICVFF